MRLPMVVLSSSIWLVLCTPAIGQNTKADPATIEAMKAAFSTPEKRANFFKQSFGVSFDQTWPSNFPVPKYPSNVLQSTFEHSTKGPPTAVAMIITKDTSKTVFDFYNSALTRAGWTVTQPAEKALAQINKGGTQFFLNATQGRQEMSITCSPHRKSNGTVVSISWRMRPK